MTTRPYTVNQPGPLTARGEGLWTVDDFVPGPRGVPRRMTVVKCDDGLTFFNAVPVPDATLAEIRALGTPKRLILPCEFHALDASGFMEKLQVEAFSSTAAIGPLAERGITKVSDISRMPRGGHQLFTVNGFRTQEQVLFAHGTLITADVVTHMKHQKGIVGFLIKLIGFSADHPILPKPVRRRVMRDGKEVKALLEQLAALPNVKQIIPSHGDVFVGDVSAALKAIAATL